MGLERFSSKSIISCEKSVALIQSFSLNPVYDTGLLYRLVKENSWGQLPPVLGEKAGSKSNNVYGGQFILHLDIAFMVKVRSGKKCNLVREKAGWNIRKTHCPFVPSGSLALSVYFSGGKREATWFF